MKKITVLAALALLLMVSASGVAAQGNRPPTIFNFTCDRPSVTVAEAEAGTSQATLTWHIAHVDESHKLLLYFYQYGEWVLLAGEQQVLPPVAGIIVNVTHSGTFAPPTYRLVVANADGDVLDERTAVITYTAGELAPTITNFAITGENVSAESLENGSARIEVSWEIADRSTIANLVFDQLLPDGTERNVELPRDSLWIPSAGNGVVAPVEPGTDQPITLRLRLVNVITAEIFDEVLVALGEPQADPDN